MKFFVVGVFVCAKLALHAPIAVAVTDNDAKTANDVNNDDDDDDLGIKDDQSLVSDEFSYANLFDYRYGALLGFGKSAPRRLMHAEFFSFLTEYFSLSVAMGYTKQEEARRERYDLTVKTRSLSLRARYYLAIIPVNFNIGSGVVSWEGDITPSNAETADFKTNEAYVATSFGAYYFWESGIYLESVLYGLSISKSFGLETTATEEFKEEIKKEIEDLQPFGILGGMPLNLMIGYVF